MTSSGATTWGLTNGGIILEAWDRVGKRPAELSREMISSAVRSLNLELQSWENMPVELWKVSLVTFPLVQGTATYVFDPKVTLVLDAYVTLSVAGQDPIDRILLPISRDEYSTYSDKVVQGAPSVYWFQRLRTPQVTIWQVPDGSSETSLNCYVLSRIEDANVGNAETPDIPVRFLDALCANVASRLALKYNKADYPMLKVAADESKSLAMTEDHERAPLRITPDFGPFYGGN